MLLVTYQCFIALSLYVQFVFNYVAIYLEGLTSLTSYIMMGMSYSYIHAVLYTGLQNTLLLYCI